QNFKQALEASLRQQIDPALLRHFAVLGIRTAGAPGLDQAAAAPLIEPNPLGLNLAGERFVGAAGPVKVFVIPGRKGMALRCVGPVVGAAQTGSNGALDGQLFLETARVAGHRTIIGLAPNGNRTVRILLGGGGSRTAPVIDNVYSLVVPASARTLIVKNSQGGTRRLRLA
ncbi:MAG TPA: hypothetical protein VFP55_06490, partial [Solirubrobacteraceae bacterium]|nr:hypothetical protein [Solirubrobacteraceae bacterium]